MTKRNIAEEILHGIREVRAWKRGDTKLRASKVRMPKAADVPGIRSELGLSQEMFAHFMGVSVGTLRNWEQERREPVGAARTLLLIAAVNPEAVRKALERLELAGERQMLKRAALGKQLTIKRAKKHVE